MSIEGLHSIRKTLSELDGYGCSMTALYALHTAIVPESAVGWPFELSELKLLGVWKLACTPVSEKDIFAHFAIAGFSVLYLPLCSRCVSCDWPLYMTASDAVH